MQRSALQLALAAAALAVLAAAPAAASYENATIDVYRTEEPPTSASQVEAAVTSGAADPADYASVDDTLVVAVESDRLAGEMRARNGSTTERFFAVLDGDPGLVIHQLNYRQEQTPQLFQLGPANTTVYRAGTTSYVVVDVAAVTLDRESPGSPREDGRVEAGQLFAVDIANASDDADETPTFEVVASPSTVVEATRNAAPEPVTVRVRTFIRPDESQAVRVVLDDGRTRTTSFGADAVGRETSTPVEVDLTGVADGTGYTLQVVHDGRVVDRRNGTVNRPTATFDDPRVVERGGDRYLNLTAELSRGGSVVTVTATGERLATVAMPTDLSIEVSVPFVDRFGRVQVPEDGRLVAVRPDGTPYPDAAYAIGDDGVPLQTPTPTPTPTPSPTADETPARSDTAGATPNGAEDMPGFGVGTALLAAALLLTIERVRRHRG
jgi:hypothetical protein